MIKLKAIILAAGEGKRLRPLTKNIPKGMVTIFGKSLLERQIDIVLIKLHFQIYNISKMKNMKLPIWLKPYFAQKKYLMVP